MLAMFWTHTSRIKLEARSAWKTAILRTRQETSELRERFTKNNIYVCEHHFNQELIESFKYKDKQGNEKVRKKLQTGAIPTENLPVKTLDLLPGSSTSQRERRVVIRQELPSSTASSSPPSFIDLKKYFERQYPYLRDWNEKHALNLKKKESQLSRHFLQKPKHRWLHVHM